MEQNPQASALLADLGLDPSELNSEKPSPSRSVPEQHNRVGLPSDFHGAVNAPVHVAKERPIHRVMALMVTKGATYREIAAATGYTPIHVGTILRQPYMRKLVADLISDAGLDPVVTMLQSAGMDTVHKLLELRDSAPPAVALGASKELMDRILGKATQTIITEKRLPEDPAVEAARLKNEIADMQKNMEGRSIGTNETSN